MKVERVAEGRYVIVLKGEAKEIWEKIPKNLRSCVVSYLLKDAWSIGKLDMFTCIGQDCEPASEPQSPTS